MASWSLEVCTWITVFSTFLLSFSPLFTSALLLVLNADVINGHIHAVCRFLFRGIYECCVLDTTGIVLVGIAAVYLFPEQLHFGSLGVLTGTGRFPDTAGYGVCACGDTRGPVKPVLFKGVAALTVKGLADAPEAGEIAGGGRRSGPSRDRQQYCRDCLSCLYSGPQGIQARGSVRR